MFYLHICRYACCYLVSQKPGEAAESPKTSRHGKIRVNTIMHFVVLTKHISTYTAKHIAFFFNLIHEFENMKIVEKIIFI